MILGKSQMVYLAFLVNYGCVRQDRLLVRALYDTF